MHVEFFYLLEILVTCILVSGEEDIGSRPEICNDGYMGVICEKRCPFPYYGDQCILKCNCRKEFCNFITGCLPPTDTCPVSFIGPYCETSCEYPHYGYGCQQHCPCSKLRCSSSTGCEVMRTLKHPG
uniref:Multiple epidermal growth factor-like domains protein 10 n=1 Tax=Crassostrea virginica TaxID=6565 RepID=A0A8B8BL96_CRAVI|nr:multiple epidermal growth factor-like domains protein 10 [Crassostrea virginica]